MHRLAAAFLDHVRTHDLLPAAEPVLIAVSGGLDSVVLLHLIRAVRPDLRIDVAHFDHAWRADSPIDATFVRALCAEMSVGCVVERAERRPAGEADARRMRYEFLQRTAATTGAARVLTAHHADDQAETILFRIARGAGTRGLSGMRAQRGRLVRPLLPFRRAELEAYAAAHTIAWRNDVTNSDERFARNRIRHRLLPALERATPGAADRLLHIAALAAEAEAYWRDELAHVLKTAVTAQDADGFTLASGVLRGYHPSVHARVLRTLARRLGTSLRRSGTRLGAGFVASGRSGAEVRIARDIVLAREFDSVIMRRRPRVALDGTAAGSAVPMGARDADDAGRTVRIEAPAEGGSELVVGGIRARFRWGPAAPGDGGSDVAFDIGTLRFPLELRGWQPGDRIRLHGGTRKLKKLFGERRIGRTHRSQVPVLAVADSQTVLWVPGVARAYGADPVGGSPVFSITRMA